MVKTNYNLFTALVLALTSVLFGLGIYINDINTVFLHTLEFLIMFEIVRTLAEFVLDKSNRIKMRYIVDAAFLFAVRELYVGLVEIHAGTMTKFTIFGYDFSMLLGLLMTILSLMVMGGLVFLRTKLVKYSPDFFKD